MSTTQTQTTTAIVARHSTKTGSGVSVDVVHPAESQIFTLEHTRESISKLCAALAPFAYVFATLDRGFRGTGSLKLSIGVRVVMLTLIRYPNLIAPCALLTIARVMSVEKRRADFQRARTRGEVPSEMMNEMALFGSRAELEFTAKDATVAMEKLAKACERLASVAEWRSRVVSRATLYAATFMAVLSLFVRADDMFCWIALYVTRPDRLRVVPDPIGAAWSRLPSMWKTVII